MADWLNDIEAQIDATVPYYVPRLIAEIRRLRPAECGEDHEVGSRPLDCFACVSLERDELLAVLKVITETGDDCPACDRGVLRHPENGHWPKCPFGQAQELIAELAAVSEATRFGPDSDTHEDRGYPPPRCDHQWGINGCQKCGQPAMPRG